MNFEVLRFSSGEKSTLGLLFSQDDEGRHFLCFTLEDEHRTEKVWGKTRIPAGWYDLKLRTFAGHHERYLQRFPEMHRGMIEVVGVEGFTDILHHIGNDDDDTAGCLLYGDQSVQNVTGRGRILASTDAYKRVYPVVRDAIEEGGARVHYVDIDEI